MTTAEDLLSRLASLKDEKKTDQEQYADAVKEYRTAQEQTREIYRVLMRVQEQHDAAKQRADEARRKSRDVEARQRDLDQQIAALQREVKRAQDAESIEEAYRQQVEALREASLGASWRKENRTDGIGAKGYQIDGAIHLAVAQQAILGDKRGLGKSLTSMVWADLRDAMKIIVISPGDTMGNYIRELARWVPHRAPIQLGRMAKAKREILLEGLSSGMVPQYTLVLNFEAWRRDDKLIDKLIQLQADTIIIDEAHHAKDFTSHASKGIRKLRYGMNKCPECGASSIKSKLSPNGKVERGTCLVCGHEGEELEFLSIKNVLPMTGTPIMNKPQDLFPLLHLIDKKGFPDLNSFLRDFCMRKANGRWVWQYGGEEAIMRKLGPRFLARTKESVGEIIPPSEPVEHIITFDEMEREYPKQAAAYKQVRDHYQLAFDEETADSYNEFIVVQMRLRQMLAWPGAIELKEKDEDGVQHVIATLDVQESVKLDRAESLIKELVEEGERVVLFSQFTAPLEILHERLGSRSVIYNGATSHQLRDSIQLDFDAATVSKEPKWDVVLANYTAAGEGINFTAASQMVILDEKWNPATMSQAYGRIDRMGQTRDTTIHTFRVEPSIDTWMAALIAEKGEMIEGFELSADTVRDMYQAMRDGLI